MSDIIPGCRERTNFIIYFVINKISSNVSLVEKKEYIGIFCFLQPNVYHGTNIHFKLCISCLFQYTL